MINIVCVTGGEYEAQKGVLLFSIEDLTILTSQTIVLNLISKFF